MFYNFYCKKCNKNHEINIPMDEYSKVKNDQKCPDCNEKLERVIEWEGVASNIGGYSAVGGMAKWQTGSTKIKSN